MEPNVPNSHFEILKTKSIVPLLGVSEKLMALTLNCRYFGLSFYKEK
jgi:hypothetical protein